MAKFWSRKIFLKIVVDRQFLHAFGRCCKEMSVKGFRINGLSRTTTTIVLLLLLLLQLLLISVFV